jgi:hypothetical protein
MAMPKRILNSISQQLFLNNSMAKSTSSSAAVGMNLPLSVDPDMNHRSYVLIEGYYRVLAFDYEGRRSLMQLHLVPGP